MTSTDNSLSLLTFPPDHDHDIDDYDHDHDHDDYDDHDDDECNETLMMKIMMI